MGRWLKNSFTLSKSLDRQVADIGSIFTDLVYYVTTFFFHSVHCVGSAYRSNFYKNSIDEIVDLQRMILLFIWTYFITEKWVETREREENTKTHWDSRKERKKKSTRERERERKERNRKFIWTREAKWAKSRRATELYLLDSMTG